MRYFCEVRYKGTNYHGWQNQKNAISVQEILETKLSLLLNEKISIMGSGRTDAGVHCKQQYFHLDISKKFKKSWFLHRINSFLDNDIAIDDISRVKDEAHARFDAVERSYEYHMVRKKDPFLTEMAYLYGKELNVPTMNKAASLLLGKQNFESFSRVHTDVSNFICEITEAKWKEDGEKLIFHISANRFLRGMVRAIVGTLLDVGEGKLVPSDIQAIIAEKDRKKASAAAPAHGLFLTGVKYPEEIFIKE